MLQAAKNTLFELETLVVFIGLYLWKARISHKHIVVFTDNMGVVGSMIKCSAANIVWKPPYPPHL